MATVESTASDTPYIAFPVTDGNSSRWPTNTRPPAPSARTVNWLRKMTVDEKHSHRWRSLAGKGIAKLLNKPDDDKYCLQSFPDGYWLFDHNKGPPSNIRHDLYLYGSKQVYRFRSPQEFIPHGYWLLTDPTLNRKNCRCKYCGTSGKKQSEISEELGLRTHDGPTAATSHRIRSKVKSQGLRSSARISGAAASSGSWVPRERRSSPQIDPRWKVTSSGLNLAANTARIFDLTTNRMFRRGELVWCQWQPEIPGIFERQDLKVDRQLWPAVVIDYCLDISVNHLPAAPGRESITPTRKYVLRRLGTHAWDRDVEYECTLTEEEILPWHAHKVDPSHVSSSSDHATPDPVLVSYQLALGAAQSLVNFWAVCDRTPVEVPLSSPNSPHAADDNSDSFRCSSAASCVRDTRDGPHPSRSTPSRYMPYSVESRPLQRSPTRLAPASAACAVTRTKSQSAVQHEHPRSESAAAAVMIETRYQGLWYGAERIWTGDLVRLAPERQAFSQTLRLSSIAHNGKDWLQYFLLPKGAEARGVLMRIDKIFARIGETGAKECAVAGPIYEALPNDLEHAVPEGSNDSNVRAPIPSLSCEPIYPWADPEHPDESVAKGGHIFNLPTPLPPPARSGYVLRPLLPPGYEIPIPVSYIAGRYYPDILESSLLNSVRHKIPESVRSMDELMLEDRQAVELLSLCALAPGRYNQAECNALRLANRSAMLREAMRVAATAEDEGDKNV